MPRFFFDTDDGSFAVKDDTGIDCADPHAARRAALACLPNMADDVMPDGDNRRFTVAVRDDQDRAIYSAVLTLHGTWAE